MSTVDELAAVAASAVPMAAAVSPLAGTVVALVAAALKAEPAVLALIEEVIADFKGRFPLDAGAARLQGSSSADLEKALHKWGPRSSRRSRALLRASRAG